MKFWVVIWGFLVAQPLIVTVQPAAADGAVSWAARMQPNQNDAKLKKLVA